MNRTMQAVITIRLAKRMGEWVSVDELARYLNLSAVTVASACQQLAALHLLHVRCTADGRVVDACAGTPPTAAA